VQERAQLKHDRVGRGEEKEKRGRKEEGESICAGEVPVILFLDQQIAGTRKWSVILMVTEVFFLGFFCF